MCLTNVLISLQLQSNLIPGLNLNALGLFPSGAPGMGPSMSSIPAAGAHGGSSPFGVSYLLVMKYSALIFTPVSYPGMAVFFKFIDYNTWGKLLKTTIH